MVYGDTLSVAFLDISPVNPGHTLVIPRRHVPSVVDLTPEEGQVLLLASQRIALAQRTCLKCEGNTIHLADGEVAGQEVAHAHFHVIPRYSGDGFGLRLPPGYGHLEDRTELDTVAARLRDALSPSSPHPMLTELGSRMVAAFNAGDPGAVASFYASDGMLMSPDGSSVAGREAIRQRLQTLLQDGMAQISVTPADSSVSADHGYVTGTYQLTTRASHGHQTVTGHFVEIWKRVGAQWRIAYDILNRVA
jgi:histidine triad (HIT) family protein